jgi:hypothetical protein
MVIDNLDGLRHTAPIRRIIGDPAYPVFVAPSTALTLTARAYRGTTLGAGTVGTVTFGSACHALNFFNKSSSADVEISLDATTWLPTGANGNWALTPPGAYASSAISKLYHRKNTAGTSDYGIQSWED